MGFVWALLIGLAAGVLAKLVTPGRNAGGWLSTMLLGVAGALLAGLAGHVAGWSAASLGAELLADALGAIAILLVYRSVMHRSVQS